MEQLTASMEKGISMERISFLINKMGIVPTIAKINLERVKIKLKDKEEGLGWTNVQCEISEVEYKRFLHLNQKFPNETIVPHTAMDLMWHQHILDTRAYHTDCEIIFGQYFHHFPYFGIRDEADRQDLNYAFEETKRIYFAEFGEEMINENTSKCTRNCVSRCKRACKT